MDLDWVMRWVIIGIGVVAVLILLKVLFYPNPLDILVLIALVTAILCLIWFNRDTGGKC